MNYQINTIEGIGPEYSSKLNQAGVNTVEDLLKKGADPLARQRLANESGCNEPTLLKWVGMADLFRISGISSQYSELLNECGVTSVNDLSHRNASKLHKKMQQVNQARQVCKVIPRLQTIEHFIHQAQTLPKIRFS